MKFGAHLHKMLDKLNFRKAGKIKALAEIENIDQTVRRAKEQQCNFPEITYHRTLFVIKQLNLGGGGGKWPKTPHNCALLNYLSE